MHWLLLTAVIPYFIILLKIYYDLKKIKRASYPSEGLASLSVVIPCRNESEKLGHLLKDLNDQDLARQEYELIFVDDNSTDNTSEVIRNFHLSGSAHNLRPLSSKGTGKKAAIFQGVSHAVNDMVVTTDADCRPDRRWLSEISRFSFTYKPDLLICPVKLSGTSGFLSVFQQLEFLALQGITAGTVAGNHPTMCNGSNLAFRKEAYLRNYRNLRHEIPSGDDIFLLQGLKREGASIMWLESAAAVVTTDPVQNLGSFLEQRKRWLSKSRYYKDSFTSILGIVTFVTILMQLFTLVAGFAESGFWLVYAAVIILKSVPDYLILFNTASRYNEKHLLKWFLPSQALYPFYVLAVLFYPEGKWKNRHHSVSHL
jgi:biofilm PGA synthesis N-glycosyltransferase PgaC